MKARTLARAETIGGMSFPAGSVVLDARGTVVSVRLPHTTLVRGVPLEGVVRVEGSAGLFGDVMLARDANVDGFACSASAPATFFHNALTGCTLRTPARVDGVPCAGTFDRIDGVRCRLASPYSIAGVRFGPGSIVSRGRERSTVTVGALAPGIRVFGAAPARGTDVRFHGHAIDIDTKTTGTACKLWYVRLERDTVTGHGYKCSVALPRSTVQMGS